MKGAAGEAWGEKGTRAAGGGERSGEGAGGGGERGGGGTGGGVGERSGGGGGDEGDDGGEEDAGDGEAGEGGGDAGDEAADGAEGGAEDTEDQANYEEEMIAGALEDIGWGAKDPPAPLELYEDFIEPEDMTDRQTANAAAAGHAKVIGAFPSGKVYVVGGAANASSIEHALLTVVAADQTILGASAVKVVLDMYPPGCVYGFRAVWSSEHVTLHVTNEGEYVTVVPRCPPTFYMQRHVEFNKKNGTKVGGHAAKLNTEVRLLNNRIPAGDGFDNKPHTGFTLSWNVGVCSGPARRADGWTGTSARAQLRRSCTQPGARGGCAAPRGARCPKGA